MTRPDVKREVSWRGRCERCFWVGPRRDAQWIAANDVAFHSIDAHGGAVRGTA